ncbi:MAG: hypothetical protein K5751_00920 [Treponemataceae bacterium]|nr:hypothetical protein [Treponemataceae bacterium]
MDRKIDTIITEIGSCNTEEQVYDKLKSIFDDMQGNLSKSNASEKESFFHNILSFLGSLNSTLYDMAGYKILKTDDIKDQLKVLSSCIFKLKNIDSSKNNEEKYMKLLEEDAGRINLLECEKNSIKEEKDNLKAKLSSKEKETDSYLELLQYLLSSIKDFSQTQDLNNMQDLIESTLRTNGISVDWNTDENRDEKFEIIRTQIKRNRKEGLPCLLKNGKVLRMGSFFEEV